jgi:hypothetical protein
LSDPFGLDERGKGHRNIAGAGRDSLAQIFREQMTSYTAA